MGKTHGESLRLDILKEQDGEDLSQAVRHAIEASPNYILALDNIDSILLLVYGRR